jgi:hypothetical protein
MKIKKFILTFLLGTLAISCSSDKTSNEGSENTTENASTIALDNAINGTWVITSIDGDGGISKDVKFVFNNNELTLDAGYFKDNVKMIAGDNSSMSYKDQNDITWKYNYSLSENNLTLDNLSNDKVHATYHLEKQ